MRLDSPHAARCATRFGIVLMTVLAAVLPAAHAQYGTRALVAPGDLVPRDAVGAGGGAIGQLVAPLVGVRPILLVYWRPGDALSEQALMAASSAQQSAAPDALLVPVAVVAAGQKVQRVQQRLGELGLRNLPPHRDAGQFARMIGVRQVPAFALIDVTGVLRLVGGGDLMQKSGAGVSILDALILASRGEAVPTLGVMTSRPIHRLLGQPLPKVALTELDGKTWRSVTEFLEPKKRLLIFYWSPLCPHCLKTLPKLRQWYTRTKPRDVILIDIAQADDRRKRNEAIPLVRDDPWIHLLDVNHGAGRALMVTETPTAFLLDDKGEVLSVNVGGEVDWGAWSGSGRSSSRAAVAR